MEDDKEFTLDYYSKKITPEPSTYSIFLEKRKLSSLNKNDLNDSFLNSETVIKDSKLTADQLIVHLSFYGFNLKELKLFDVGCGLGFITNELAKNIGYNNVYCSDPSPSTKDFINLEFPNLNFIYSDIENTPEYFNNYFDIVYLREVYPFTRTNNFDLHKKLLQKLFKLTKKNGLVILEQIKGVPADHWESLGDQNIFNNLRKLNYNYDIKIAIPNRLLKNKFFLVFKNLNYKFVNILLRFLYSIKKIKARYYITFKKV